MALLHFMVLLFLLTLHILNFNRYLDSLPWASHNDGMALEIAGQKLPTSLDIHLSYLFSVLDLKSLLTSGDYYLLFNSRGLNQGFS